MSKKGGGGGGQQDKLSNFLAPLERFPLMLKIPPDGPQDSCKCEVANRYCSEKNHILEHLRNENRSTIQRRDDQLI